MNPGRSNVIASITVSVDGYVTGPDDHAGQGLGIGGERLHYWVMGGPWTYEGSHDTDGMTGADREFFETLTEGMGAGIVGRGMYDAAGAWGGTNPFPGPLWVLTHRTEDAPDESTGFRFSPSFDEALSAASEAAGEGVVAIGGGADTIRQALRAGVVDTLAISTAPVILGGGKRLFEGFDQDVDLTPRQTFASEWATHVIYDVGR